MVRPAFHAVYSTGLTVRVTLRPRCWCRKSSLGHLEGRTPTWFQVQVVAAHRVLCLAQDNTAMPRGLHRACVCPAHQPFAARRSKRIVRVGEAQIFLKVPG